MRSETLEAFERALVPTLSRFGFHVVERDDPDIFDNGLVVYQSNGVRVRLIVDRGFRSMDVSIVSDPDVWLDLQPMINRAWHREIEHIPTPNEFAIFLGENFEALQTMLSRRMD